MRRNVVYWILCLVLFGIVSCKKEMEPIVRPGELPGPEPELGGRAGLNREVARLLEDVYRNPKAFYEASAAILSEYYEDETVLLKDLLFPEYSPLYASAKFKSFNAPVGVFKNEFYQALNKGKYPLLKNSLYPQEIISSGSGEVKALSPATDTAAEIFSNSKGVAIYFPYSENFGSLFTTSYFDNVNKDPRGKLATIVAADREADEAPGKEPYLSGTRTNPIIAWMVVNVNDNYAELNPTHIVGVGAEPYTGEPIMDSSAVPGGILRVYQGHMVLKEQMDKFISVSGNGGGSEVFVNRVSGYLSWDDGVINSFSGDMIRLKFKRKDIRKKRVKTVCAIWDANWQPKNLEQVYAVWENDKTVTKKIEGELKTTLRVRNTGLEIVGTISFSLTVTSDNPIIRQLKLDRVSYLAGAKKDQGCFFSNQKTFLTTGTWPWYDCGTSWQWAMPYQYL
jgi:hypothetical protein